MSKNIKLNNTDYNGVSTVQLPTTSGGTATFKDTDEIMTPSGTKTITENGTHDVTNFAQAIVNVPTSGGSGSSGNSYEMGTFTLTEAQDNYTYEHSLGRVPKFAIVYPISIDKNTSDEEHHNPYAIAEQTILNGLGQENYNISSKDSVIANSPFATYYGVSYSSSTDGCSNGFSATYGTNLEFTETTVVVGMQSKLVSSSGHLTVGTYGIIVG